MSHLKDAMMDELDYFNDVVWTGVPLQQALNDKEGTFFGNNCNVHNCQTGGFGELARRIEAIMCTAARTDK